MTTLSKQEALDLLSQPLICEDHEGWEPDRDIPNTFRFINGLLFPDGSRARLFVEITVKLSKQTQIKHFTFTVMRPKPFQGRVYQLEIRNLPKALRDQHQWPHEHFGQESERCMDWKDWSFESAFEHFKKQTNIHFQPKLISPFDLELTHDLP